MGVSGTAALTMEGTRVARRDEHDHNTTINEPAEPIAKSIWKAAALFVLWAKSWLIQQQPRVS